MQNYNEIIVGLKEKVFKASSYFFAGTLIGCLFFGIIGVAFDIKRKKRG